MNLPPFLIKPVYAAITNPILPIGQDLSGDIPYTATNKVIQTVVSVALLVAVVYFMWFMFMAGYHWIDSQGDPKKYEQAKNELTYGVIGLAVIFCTFAVLRFIGIVFGITGLSTLTLTWPNLL